MAGYDDFSGLLGLMQGQGLGQAEAYPEPVQTAAPRVSMGSLLKDNWGLLGTVAALSALAGSNGRRSVGQVIGNAGLDALSALGQVGMAKMKRDQLQQQNDLARSQWEAADADRKLRSAIALGDYNLKLGKQSQELRERQMLAQMLGGAGPEGFGQPQSGGTVQPGLTPLPGSEDDRAEFGRPSGSGAGLGRLAQVPTQTGMGRVMAYHESGTQGSQHVSYGLPETDGVDVGKYSFITKGGSGGSAGAFIRWAGQQDSAVGRQLFNQFHALTGGNWSALDNPALWKSQGAAIWTALAKADPLEFEKLEDGFALGRINSVIKRDLDPGLQAAIKADKTGALYEMALSTINQHGNAASILNRQWRAHGGEGPESFIKAVYWDRGDPYWFRRTKDPSMGRRRMNQEVQDVLGILHSGGAQGQPAPASAGAQGNPLAPVQVPGSVPRMDGGAQGNPLASQSARGTDMSAVPRMDSRQAAALMPMSLQGRQRPQQRVPMGAVLLGGNLGPALYQADQDRIRNEQDAYYKDRDFARQLEQDNWNRELQTRQEARAESKEKRDQTKFEAEMDEKAEKRQKREELGKDSADGMLEDIAAIRSLAAGSTLPVFGPGGMAPRRVPGTNAYNANRLLESLKGRIAFESLQRMRAASPTGGALGAVSDAEQEMLKNSVAALDPNMSPAQIERSLQRIEGMYLDVIHGRGNWSRGRDGSVMLRYGQTRQAPSSGPAQQAQPQPRQSGGSQLPPGFKPVN